MASRKNSSGNRLDVGWEQGLIWVILLRLILLVILLGLIIGLIWVDSWIVELMASRKNSSGNEASFLVYMIHQQIVYFKFVNC